MSFYYKMRQLVYPINLPYNVGKVSESTFYTREHYNIYNEVKNTTKISLITPLDLNIT